MLPLTLTDADGKRRRVPAEKSLLSVLIFVSLDCPIGNAYAPEIERLRTLFAPKGVTFFLVYAESEGAIVRKHLAAYRLRATGLLDSEQKLSQATGATVTPEAVLLEESGKRLYRGRIDDRWVDYGKKRPRPTRHDLYDAISAAYKKRPIAVPETKAIGCFLPPLPPPARENRK